MRAAPAGALPAGALMSLAVMLSSCAHRGVAPADTAGAFGAALERGDYAGAYALTSADTRQRLPYPAFAALLAADPDETKAFGHRLVAGAHRVPARAEVTLEAGEAFPLVLEDGRWLASGVPFEPWGQRTPRDALRTFVRALEQRRYDITLRLVPNRYRGELTPDKLRRYWEEERKDDHVALLARLRAALAGPIVESGDEAHLPYGPDQEVRFVREDGRWKVESPQ